MSARTPVRVAIVGAGLMGRWHGHAARRAGGKVALVIDSDGQRAAALARRHGGSRVLDGFDAERIARDAVVAHVCTPLATHERLVADLIAAGVHVLAEKPLTDDARSTQSLLASAASARVLLCPVHQMPFQRGVLALVDRLPRLGDLTQLEFSACSAGAAKGGDADQDRLIDDILPHPLSLFRRVLGRDVRPLGWQITRPRAGELRAIASSGNTVVSISVSSHGRPTSNLLRAIAGRGTVDVDLFHGFAAFCAGAATRVGKLSQPFSNAATTLGVASVNVARRVVAREWAYPGLNTLVRRFHAAVADGVPPPISADEVADIAAARDVLRKAR